MSRFINGLQELLDKSRFVDWNTDKRTEHFAVVSKSGFANEGEAFAMQNNFLLRTQTNIKKIFLTLYAQ